jgi:cytochrome P450
MRGFVFEGIRHANSTPGLVRVTAHDVTIVDGTRGSILIPASHTVLVATSLAAMDPVAFPEPEKIDPGRPLELYSILFGTELGHYFGQQVSGASLAATLKEVFRLKNVRRAPGRQGVLTTTEHTVGGVRVKKYFDAGSREAKIPKSLTLHYDE